jgi:hypothetical protein
VTSASPAARNQATAVGIATSRGLAAANPMSSLARPAALRFTGRTAIGLVDGVLGSVRPAPGDAV